MRGKHYVKNFMGYSTGITPADAGKTSSATDRGRTVGDHPRGCGENRFVYRLVVHSSGSPPRMRGKLDGLSNSRSCHGITPADAGKTDGF